MVKEHDYSPSLAIINDKIVATFAISVPTDDDVVGSRLDATILYCNQ
jgi:hypothetical protein